MIGEPRLTLSDGRVAGHLFSPAPDRVDHAVVRSSLRELADAVHADPGRRSWAVLGELDPPGALHVDDQLEMTRWVVSHDELGRLAVRLDIGQVICVGTSRAVHGLHQGAVMEGSWGSEAVLVSGPDEALDILDAQLGEHDVVLVLGGRDLGLTGAVTGRVPAERPTPGVNRPDRDADNRFFDSTGEDFT